MKSDILKKNGGGKKGLTSGQRAAIQQIKNYTKEEEEMKNQERELRQRVQNYKKLGENINRLYSELNNLNIEDREKLEEKIKNLIPPEIRNKLESEGYSISNISSGLQRLNTANVETEEERINRQRRVKAQRKRANIVEGTVSGKKISKREKQQRRKKNLYTEADNGTARRKKYYIKKSKIMTLLELVSLIEKNGGVEFTYNGYKIDNLIEILNGITNVDFKINILYFLTDNDTIKELVDEEEEDKVESYATNYTFTVDDTKAIMEELNTSPIVKIYFDYIREIFANIRNNRLTDENSINELTQQYLDLSEESAIKELKNSEKSIIIEKLKRMILEFVDEIKMQIKGPSEKNIARQEQQNTLKKLNRITNIDEFIKLLREVESKELKKVILGSERKFDEKTFKKLKGLLDLKDKKGKVITLTALQKDILPKLNSWNNLNSLVVLSEKLNNTKKNIQTPLQRLLVKIRKDIAKGAKKSDIFVKVLEELELVNKMNQLDTERKQFLENLRLIKNKPKSIAKIDEMVNFYLKGEHLQNEPNKMVEDFNNTSKQITKEDISKMVKKFISELKGTSNKEKLLNTFVNGLDEYGNTEEGHLGKLRTIFTKKGFLNNVSGLSKEDFVKYYKDELRKLAGNDKKNKNYLEQQFKKVEAILRSRSPSKMKKQKIDNILSHLLNVEAILNREKVKEFRNSLNKIKSEL